MFASPYFSALKIKRTRYFVPLRRHAERHRAREGARLRQGRPQRPASRRCCTSPRATCAPSAAGSSRRAPIAATSGGSSSYFRKLGVRDFGAWNEVNHKTQETWNHIGNAVSYFKSMYRAVKQRCRSCARRRPRRARPGRGRSLHPQLLQAPEHDLAQAADDRSGSTTTPTSTATARRGTRKIINTVRRYNSARSSGSRRPARWRASAARSPTASRARRRASATCSASPASTSSRGVQRVYSYNWFGADDRRTAAARCLFDAGLVEPRRHAAAGPRRRSRRSCASYSR